ncbi:myb/SANT-like DNA-binding domain-containing protein 3 [Ixodes scapularis]|uniref:myb/SANT-like DNA-binding domain-containing protein 3 n=1 Tax=Ixodes scapularis TaxID=6945 RepID=UPI001A9E9AEF|nr:myb/SANT-like DNA-binding domain-containing protein 3 [Ixodes scapularis]
MPKQSANEGRIVYTREERDLLRALVQKYWKVIEDKRTNNSSKEAKLEAWEKLCTEYNCQPNVCPRDVKQLKKCWDNAKSRWKKSDSEEKRDIHATGGGPRTCRPMSPSLQLVGALASHMATRLGNPHDSDCAHADQPVLSLPPAAMLEAMVDQRANLDMMPDSPALPASPASPPLDWGDSMEPAFAASPPRPPNPPSPQPTRVAPRAKPAVGRVAAFEAMLAPETNARVAALEREELRKEELHQLQVQLLRGQQQRIELELELLQLDKRIKLQQLLALEAKTQD